MQKSLLYESSKQPRPLYMSVDGEPGYNLWPGDLGRTELNTTAHVKSARQGKLGTTIQNHSDNGGLFKNFDTAKFFTFNKSFVTKLSFRLLQSLRLLSSQIISFVHRGYFSEHQVKTCLKNTSPRKCSEILAIPGVHVVILPLHSSPDWVLLHRSRCGDWKFPSTLYKSNTVRNHRIFADWSF